MFSVLAPNTRQEATYLSPLSLGRLFRTCGDRSGTHLAYIRLQLVGLELGQAIAYRICLQETHLLKQQSTPQSRVHEGGTPPLLMSWRNRMLIWDRRGGWSRNLKADRPTPDKTHLPQRKPASKTKQTNTISPEFHSFPNRAPRWDQVSEPMSLVGAFHNNANY